MKVSKIKEQMIKRSRSLSLFKSHCRLLTFANRDFNLISFYDFSYFSYSFESYFHSFREVRENFLFLYYSFDIFVSCFLLLHLKKSQLFIINIIHNFLLKTNIIRISYLQKKVIFFIFFIFCLIYAIFS